MKQPKSTHGLRTVSATRQQKHHRDTYPQLQVVIQSIARQVLPTTTYTAQVNQLVLIGHITPTTNPKIAITRKYSLTPIPVQV